MVREIKGVTVVDHPLVQHKLTLMRKKDPSTKSSRQLLKEIGALLCYEVTRDLPMEEVEIETPLSRMTAPQLAGKKLVFAPILRSGAGGGGRAVAPPRGAPPRRPPPRPPAGAGGEFFFRAPAPPPTIPMPDRR